MVRKKKNKNRDITRLYSHYYRMIHEKKKTPAYIKITTVFFITIQNYLSCIFSKIQPF